MDVSKLISAMKELVSSDRDSSGHVSWTEKLLHNTKKTKELLAPFPVVEKIRSENQLVTRQDDDTLWEFVAEGLTVFLCLHKTLCMISPSDEIQKLLSISDQKTLRTLTQFISLLGLYRYLDTGVGIATNKSVTKLTDMDSNQRETCLYRCLKALLECIYNDTLTSTMLPVILSNVLASLLQIIYKPNTDTMLLREEKQWCQSQLQYLLDHVSQPLVVRELLVLQSSSLGKNLSWLQKACGELLSQQLMKKNGVQFVLRGIFEGGTAISEQSSENWKKCQAIAKVISNCPSQAVSVDHYYSLICPQIISLFDLPHDGVGRQFLRVSVLTLSMMLHKHTRLTIKYLINPLIQPLRQLTGEDDCADLNTIPAALKNSLTNLNRIICTIETTAPFISVIVSYLPVIFDVWKLIKKNESSLMKKQCKELLVNVLKMSDANTQQAFIDHLLYIELSSTEVQFKCVLNKFNLRPLPAETSAEFFVTEDNSSDNRNFNSQTMEEIGSCIIDLLLDKELKPMVGQVFLSLLKHFSSVLAVESGLENNKSLTRQCNNLEGTTSTVLLDWEQESVHSEVSTFSNALVLFMLAALCENLDIDDCLQKFDMISVMELLSKIIKCHSFCCKEIRKYVSLARESSKDMSIDQLTGGRVSLSISFGLLSAYLTTTKQIDRTFRPVLSDLLPYLECICHCYPDEELSSLASDLKICISTLGAVWSVDMKGKAQEFKPQKANSHLPTRPLIEEIEPTLSTDSEDGNDTLFTQAMRELQDPLLPIQSHGIKQLTSLIRSKDTETVQQSKKLIEIFSRSLHHTDSYIYLPAIQGLVALACIEPDMVLPLLCQKYAQFSEAEAKFDQTTGKYFHQTLTRSTSSSSSAIDCDNNLEWRVKVGEALVQIVRELGELLPSYHEPILAAVLCNVRHSDPLIRASALSNLASICKTIKWSFTSIQNEVITCIADVIKCEPEPSVRRGAINVAKELFEGLGTQTDKVLTGESLLVLYRVLKTTESTDPDHLTRTHAQTALGELDSVMRQLLFPIQSLTKKISILDHI